jgi:alpha-glucosidase
MDFTCALDNGTLQINISKHQGTFVPWWKEFRIEVYGWKPVQNKVVEDGNRTNLVLHRQENHFELTLPDSGNGTVLNLR